MVWPGAAGPSGTTRSVCASYHSSYLEGCASSSHTSSTGAATIAAGQTLTTIMLISLEHLSQARLADNARSMPGKHLFAFLVAAYPRCGHVDAPVYLLIMRDGCLATNCITCKHWS